VHLLLRIKGKTGAGMMACKKALEETRGNLEEAINYLRIKGISDADKKLREKQGRGL